MLEESCPTQLFLSTIIAVILDLNQIPIESAFKINPTYIPLSWNQMWFKVYKIPHATEINNCKAVSYYLPIIKKNLHLIFTYFLQKHSCNNFLQYRLSIKQYQNIVNIYINYISPSSGFSIILPTFWHGSR